MTKRALALICSIGFLAGCGGSSHSTQSGASTGQRQAACVQFLSAKDRYLAATRAMSLRFTDKPLLSRTLAATEAFRRSAAVLQPLSTSAEQEVVGKLAANLALQEKELRAFYTHDLAAAQKYGNQLNGPLSEALAKVGVVC